MRRPSHKIIIYIVITILVIVYITKCQKKEPERVKVSHEMVLTQIESLGNLQVVKYNIQDIVEYEKVRTWLPNSKTALIVVGEVTGCIDLTKLGKGDIQTFDDSVSIVLPDPEICTVKIDHSRSRVYDTRFGLWEQAKLIDEAYAYAEEQIEIEAKKMGIAVDCQENTQKLLTPILKSLGFEKVSIRFKTEIPVKSFGPSEQSSLKVIQ